MKLDTAYNIPSEAVEPFATMIVGRMWARCEEAKKKHGKASHEHYNALNHFWWALRGLEHLAVAVQTATHFSVAMNGHIIGVAGLIEAELDFNPMDSKDPNWNWRR